MQKENKAENANLRFLLALKDCPNSNFDDLNISQNTPDFFTLNVKALFQLKSWFSIQVQKFPFHLRTHIFVLLIMTEQYNANITNLGADTCL